VSAAIDAMILIWGLKQSHYKRPKQESSDLASMRERSVWLIEGLAAEKKPVIAPSIAVAEFLIGVDPNRHGDMIAVLQERFIIQPFDLPAMSLAARLWNQIHAAPKDNSTTRNVLKSDVVIAATAKSAGASVVYSHDKHLRKLAEMLNMTGSDLPTGPPHLFADVSETPEPEE
jgi:predicted nucleic acid-binding protein